MNTTPMDVEAVTAERYRNALTIAVESGVPFIVGGGYALEHYTRIRRRSIKDLDLFVRRTDLRRLLEVFATAGFETDLPFPHWLAKIHVGGDDFIDVIWSSGNGVSTVDEGWFEHALETSVLGCPVRLSPPEEMIWSKGFIMERERYDGADIAHLIRACHAVLDWERLLHRFDRDWRVLLSHLVLFEYIYPGERGAVPEWVWLKLNEMRAIESSAPAPPLRLCRGTLLSRAQYLPDIQDWGYEDARRKPHGTMTADDVARWTEPVTAEGSDDADCRGR